MEEKEAQRILDRINDAERWRDSYSEQWQDCYRRYRSQVKNKREGSNIFVPHTFMQCEVIKARMEESLFAQRPYLAALPREGSDVEAAEKMQLLLDWQLNERMNLPRILGEQMINSLLIYGTAICYTGWQVKTRKVKRAMWQERDLCSAGGEKLCDEQGQSLRVPEQHVMESVELIYDDPVVANISLQEFFVDPAARNIDEARFCGHSEYVTRGMLEELEAQGKYKIDWDKLPALSDDNGREGMDSFEPGDVKGLYLVHHYWEDDRHAVFVNRAQCVCDESNPFWHGSKPYDKCCYVQLPGEFYGIGIPELLAGLQDELNTCRNQRIDYNSLALRRMWKLRKGSGLTARDLVWRQNGVLQVENMDDVQEINLQGLPADAFANESSVKNDMQDVTGCYDILMGISYTSETATTTLTRDNNASLRFKTVVRSIIEDMLVPVARKCASMDQQFLSEQKVMRLLGESAEELFTLSPQEICGEYDIRYCGSAIESLANKEQNKERALQAYSLALADPAYQRDDAARLKLFKKVLAALEMSDSDDLLPMAEGTAEAALEDVLSSQAAAQMF